jgi:hypothetical protein
MTIAMAIRLDGDNAFPELRGYPKIVHLSNDAPPIQAAVLDAGMASGLPSIVLRVDLPDGTVVLAETSARLFCMAAKAIMGKYPDLFEGEQ